MPTVNFLCFFKTEIKKTKKKERKKKPQYIYFCIIMFSYGKFSKHFPLLSWALSPCKYFIGPAAGLLQNAINLGDHVVTYRIFNNDYKTLLLFCFLVIAVSKFHFFALFFMFVFLVSWHQLAWDLLIFSSCVACIFSTRRSSTAILMMMPVTHRFRWWNPVISQAN